MKHSKLFTTVALAALAVLPAFAQTKVNEFPKLPTFKTGQAPATKHTPTAINDKALGQYMYAGQLTDQSKLPGWVRFRTANAANFEQLARYRETIDHLGAMRMGAYDTQNNKYYGVFSLEYTLSFYPTNFAEVNVANGDTTTIHQYTETEQSNWYNGNYLYAMAFDPASNTLYALGVGYKDVDGNTVGFTKLYSIDPGTGDATEVQDFDVIYYNFAFDYDGNAWFVQPKAGGDDGMQNVGTTLVKMDNDFNILSSVDIQSQWNEQYVMAYFGTMAFDYTTGDLYWIPVTSYGATSLLKVNTTTGITDYAGYFMSGNSFVGLYIPYLTADSRKAPAQVSGLDAQADVNGAMTDTVKWVNPTLAWDKSDVGTLTNVKIYRKNAGVATTELTRTEELLSSTNSTLVATVDGVEAGKASQWIDTKPLKGINTYYVLATNAEGNGVLDSIRCYMGADVPGPVTDIQIEKDGDGISLSWKAPEEGLNNGYIPAEGLTYTVTRFPDSVVVAKNITATSFDDQTLGEQQSYYYTIQAANEAGEGSIATSGHIMAGKAISVPVNLTFKSNDDASRWTNLPMSAFYWSYQGWDGGPDEYNALGTYGGYSEMDGGVVSPPLRLEAGKTYRFTTDFWVNYGNTPYDFKLAVGTTDNDLSSATTIRDDKNVTWNQTNSDVRNQFEDYFTAPETGTYYYYLDVATHSQYNNFRLYGLSVDLVSDNDLKAVSIDNIIEAVANQDNTATVRLRNVGSKDQSKYTVKIIAIDEGKETVVGETSEVPTIKSSEYAEVPVTFKPTKEGQFDFYGVVSLEGDDNSANDTTAVKTLNVQPAGTTPWTNVVTSGQAEGISTRVPFANYEINERTKSIYLNNEVNAPANARITRLGYIYDSSDNLTDRTDPVTVKIYLGYADNDFYASADQAGSDNDFTLVYESDDVRFEPGTNHLISFDLDTPFDYDNTRNLAVIVDKEGNCGTRWAAHWHVFNTDLWTAAQYRSVLYDGTGAFSGTYSGIDPAAPILYLGITNPTTGIEETVVPGGSSVTFANGALRLGNNIKSAEVFTVDGRKVADINAGNAQANLKRGIYIVRAKTTDGKTTTVKLNVNK